MPNFVTFDDGLSYVPISEIEAFGHDEEETNSNTSCTIVRPASLRSDGCSPSYRNAVRLPTGIAVQIHRNTHPGGRGLAVRTPVFCPVAPQHPNAVRACSPD